MEEEAALRGSSSGDSVGGTVRSKAADEQLIVQRQRQSDSEKLRMRRKPLGHLPHPPHRQLVWLRGMNCAWIQFLGCD